MDASRKWARVSCGGTFTVALSESGELYSFGYNQCGALGHGPWDGAASAARQAAAHADTAASQRHRADNVHIVDVACGNYHTLLLTNDGIVYAMGSNGNGECGLGAAKLHAPASQFWRLIQRIRDRYFPAKEFVVQKQIFVNRQPLETMSGLFSFFTDFELVGTGSFGTVYVVRELVSGKLRVCKCISKAKALVAASQIEIEISAMKALNHPNILKIFDVFEDAKHVYLILEHCSGGELYKRITQSGKHGCVLAEGEVRGLMKQIFQALAYMHSKKVLHKDLKPENILFNDRTTRERISIIDFGLSEIFDNGQDFTRNAAGTVTYMAPEVFARKLCFKSDMWSAGVLMFLLLTGHLPYSGSTVLEVRRKVTRIEPAYERRCQHVTKVAVDLLRNLLNRNVAKRFSAVEALQHPWFKVSDTEIFEYRV
uniref:Calcium-dependent protein kinase 3-like n=1 Tax=Dermatophagoides pteronyssinus TaxID=6956 RepID=A0A6P6Y8F3_DERPT|nr:calcium-dependent protein kinase 3-like [Dermatophagoides pteronyssinus]